MNACPTPDQLEALLDERLGGTEHARVTDHVGGCEACQKFLDQLTADQDADTLRVRPAVPADEPASLTQFFGQLKQPADAEASLEPKLFAAGSQPAPNEECPILPGYEILDVLGHGGEGVVFKARQRSLNRVVALKMVRTSGQPDLARFQREAEALARLQHPNIVHVYEVGQHAGRPFFAMEYVDGGTLAMQLAGRPRAPVEAASLLEIVAHAVHAAHKAGIVHRDLKPANLLLTAPRPTSSIISNAFAPVSTTDQTLNSCGLKVSDFGLARHIHVPEAVTRAGYVLGTPGYMAPEQAQARPDADRPACDIYSLGAVLYEMLTGRPPFAGTQPMDVLMQVVHDEPLPLRRLVPQVPRDLETICLKCLQKEPERRYRSARALADDLRRFRHGEPIRARPVGRAERAWKWARRRPAVSVLAAALVAVVLLALAGLTGLYLHADAERQRAERGEAQAHANLAEANRQHEEVLRQKARADENQTRARKAVEDYLNKITEHAKLKESDFLDLRKDLLLSALPFYGEMLQTPLDDPVAERQRGWALRRLAQLRAEAGDGAGARGDAEKAIAVFVALAKAKPNDAIACQDLAAGLNHIAVLLTADHQMADAEAAYRKALELYERLTSAYPHEPDFRDGEAQARLNLGRLLRLLGRLDEAGVSIRQAIAVRRQLVNDFHEKAGHQAELARGYVNLGLLHRDLKQTTEAEAAYRQAQVLLEKLVAVSPAAPGPRAELGSLSVCQAVLWMEQARSTDAERAYRKAATLFEKLATDFPNVPGYRRELAQASANLGLLYQRQGRHRDAELAWHRAAGFYERLATDFPADVSLRRALVLCWSNLAALLTNSGRLPEAESYSSQLLSQLEKLADLPPPRQDKSLDRAWRPQTEAVCLQAAALFERLATASPGEARYRQLLARTHAALARLRQQAGQLAEAITAYREALASLEKLHADTPGSARRTLELGDGYIHFANLLSASGKPAEALAWYAKAVPVLEAVRPPDVLVLKARESLCNAFQGRAKALGTLGRHAEAAPAWEQALAYDAGASRDRLRRQWALALARAGEPGRAAEEVEAITRTRESSGADAVELSRVLAVAAITTKDAALAERYAAQAVTLLSKAPTANEAVKQDKDFDVLRDRPDFQAVVAAAPAPP